MPQTGLISELVDEKVFAQEQKLIDLLAQSEAKLLDNVEAAQKLNTVLGGSKSIPDYNKNLKETSSVIDKTVASQEKARLAEINLQKAREKAFDDYEKKLAKQQADSKKAADQQEAASQKELANMVKLSKQREKDSLLYTQLSKRLDGLRESAKELGITYGTNSDIFKAAQAEVNSLDSKLKGLDASLGQNQKNVGNYASAAFGFIRQLAYILPGIGIAGIFSVIFEGLTQVYQAISNGGGVLKTNYDLVTKTNDAYAEQSTQVSLLARELLNSNTSTERRGELLEELNKLSPTYFGNLKNESDIVTKLPAAYAAYNRALLLTSRITAATSLIAEKYKDLLNLQNDEFNDNASTIEAYILKLGKLTGSTDLITAGIGLSAGRTAKQTDDLTKSIDFLIKTVGQDQKRLSDNGGDIAGATIERQQRIANNFIELNKIQLQSYIEMQDKIANNEQKSYAQREAALKRSTTAQIQLAKLTATQELDNVALQNDERNVIEAKSNAEIAKLRSDLSEKLRELNNKEIEDIVKKYQLRLDAAKSTEQAIENDQKASFETRLNAVRDYQKKALDLINKETAEELKLAGNNAQKIQQINATKAKQIADVQKQVNADSAKLQAEAQRDIQRLVSTLQQRSENDLKNSLTKRESEIEESKANETLIISKQYAAGTINQQQYNAKIRDLNAQSDTDRIAAERETALAILGIRQGLFDALTVAGLSGFGPSDKDIQDAKANFDKLDLMFKGQLSKNIVTDTDKKHADIVKQQADIAEGVQYLQQVQQSALTIINQGYQAQINLLDRQKQAIQDSADAETAAVNRSVLSQSEKQRKIDIINAQAKSKEDALTKQQNELKRKQAIADKAANIATIIENTAVAISKTLAEGGAIFGIPLVPVIAALGAIQLATAIAQPIPQYWTGTPSSKGGAAWVGEKGTELAINPDGSSWLTPSVPTLVNLQPGTKIINNKEYMQMVASPNKYSSTSTSFDLSAMVNATRNSTERIEKAIFASNKAPRMLGVNNDKYNGYKQGLRR